MATSVDLSPFYYNIAQTTLGSAPLTGNFGFNKQVNITIVNGGGADAILTIADNSGAPKAYTISNGNPAIIKRALVRTFSISGSGAISARCLAGPTKWTQARLPLRGLPTSTCRRLIV